MVSCRVVVVALGLSWIACAPPEAVKTEAVKTELVKTEPEEPPLPEEPSMDDALPVPGAEALVGVGDCNLVPELPAGASAEQQALVPAIKVLRDISCRPELLGLTTPLLLRRIGAPSDLPLTVVRRHARVEFAAPVRVRDVLAVLGVKRARMRLQQGWGTTWHVGAGDTAAPLKPFGPGEITVRIRGERHEDAADGAVLDIPEDAVVDEVGVTMPEDAIRFLPDPHGAPAVAAAIIGMAREPALLKLPPKQARARLKTLGERYSLDTYSIGMGEKERFGFVVRPTRTELPADAFAAALGLAGASHDRVGVTDRNQNRLAYQGRTEFVWHGLELEVELVQREGAGVGLAGWLVDEILVLPAPTN